MTPTKVSVTLAFTVILPFVFAVAFAVFAGAPRARRLLAVAYALVMVVLDVLLLEGFLRNKKILALGSLKMTKYGFPVLFFLVLVSAAVVLFKGARGGDERQEGLLTATIAGAAGFGLLAALATSMIGFAFFWEGATLMAVIGLAAHGASGFRGRLLSFAPWLGADLLFWIGVLLCRSYLKEGGLLISQPLLHGTETQVEAIMILFLLSAVLRLGLFPLNVRRRLLVARCEGTWNAFFLCGLNVLLTGYFLLVTATLMAHLMTSDWSIVIAIAGTLSVVAGPVIAARSHDFAGYLSGMLMMVGGLLVLCAGLFSRAGLEAFLLIMLTAPLALAAVALAGRRGKARVAGPAVVAGLLLGGLSLAVLPPTDGFVSRGIAALACLDKALMNPWYSLIAALVLAGFGIAACATFIAVPRELKAEHMPGVAREKAFTEAIPVLAMLAFVIGVIPGPLIRNFVDPASHALFASGFTGPGVVFYAGSGTVSKAVAVYPGWSQAAAAFILACALAALLPYLFRKGAGKEAMNSGD